MKNDAIVGKSQVAEPKKQLYASDNEYGVSLDKMITMYLTVENPVMKSMSRPMSAKRDVHN